MDKKPFGHKILQKQLEHLGPFLEPLLGSNQNPLVTKRPGCEVTGIEDQVAVKVLKQQELHSVRWFLAGMKEKTR